MPKFDRYFLGQKVLDLILEMLMLTMRAEYEDRLTKTQTLKRMVPKLDSVKILVRLSWSVNVLDEKTYIRYENKLQEIGKMLGGWIRSLIKNR